MLVMYNPISLKGDKGTLLTGRVASRIAIFFVLVKSKKNKYYAELRETAPSANIPKSMFL